MSVYLYTRLFRRSNIISALPIIINITVGRVEQRCANLSIIISALAYNTGLKMTTIAMSWSPILFRVFFRLSQDTTEIKSVYFSSVQDTKTMIIKEFIINLIRQR